MFKYLIKFSFFLSILFPQEIIYEEPKYFDISNTLKINQIDLSKNFDLSNLKEESFFRYNENEKKYYFLKIQFNAVQILQFEFNKSNINNKIKIFIIDLNREGWVGPYSNINKEYYLPHYTDRIKSSDIIIEIVMDSKNNFKNPFAKIINPESKKIKLKKEKKTKYFLKSNTRNHRRKILLCGYWPPSNECIRPFSKNIDLNPEGWIGQNWEESGFDIVSYFPTFEDPDCNSCGQGNGDFEVDYQDTSEDWWNIVDSINPVAIITFSRGMMLNQWELEAKYVNYIQWVDDFTAPFQPTPAPPDSTLPIDSARFSNLPMDSIVSQIFASELDLYPFIDEASGAGNYLSEFMGYHGVWYKNLFDFDPNPLTSCYIAGHIHVGGQVDWETGFEGAKISLREVIKKLNEILPVSGDLNQDGVLSILDFYLLITVLSGDYELNDIEFHIADVNFDSKVDIFDLIIISDTLTLAF